MTSLEAILPTLAENATRVSATRHDATLVMPCHTWDFNARPLTQVWHRTEEVMMQLLKHNVYRTFCHRSSVVSLRQMSYWF